jgi:hypothetical protein
VRIIISSDHFITQRSTYSFRSRSWSTRWARFSGSALAVNERYSSEVGSTPQMSRLARLRNSSSVHRSEGWIRSVRSLASTSSSIRAVAGGSDHSKATSFGSVIACAPTVCVSNRAITKASPRRPAVTSPAASTFAAASLLERNRASGVTSRSVPSAYLASTVSCCVAAGPSSTASAGWSSTATTAGVGPGSFFAPVSSQRFRVA